ncbi:MAG: PEP-CTERM sorting domain-containing protein [Gammaproteobacteria bacterium]
MKIKGKFMKYTLGLLGFVVGSSLWATSSQAIPVSYGQSSHTTDYWQELANDPAGDEYGVTWSVDGGSTWGREELYVGQTVQFKFNVHKDHVGTHYADLTKAWVDWDQDGTFDASDKIFYAEHLISANPQPTWGYGTNAIPTIPDLEYFSSTFNLTDDFVGDLWLRALVTCSESVVTNNGGGWWDQWSPYYKNNYDNLLKPTGHYHQGETEEWKLVVHSVPESSALILFGLGIAGLTVARRRSK